MSFFYIFKKLFSKKNNNNKEKDPQTIILKQIQHKYLNKTPLEISKMNVRDITMALQQLNLYCIKKIQKAINAKDINKRNLNLLKQAKVSEQAYKYICELIKILENKDNNRQYAHLIKVKKSARVYNSYIYNFQTAFDKVNKEIPGSLTNSPNAAWQKLMRNIPDDMHDY